MSAHPVRPITLKIEPKSNDDQPRLGAALAQLASEDAEFAFSIDPESGETIIEGVSELNLDSKIGKLIRFSHYAPVPKGYRGPDDFAPAAAMR